MKSVSDKYITSVVTNNNSIWHSSIEEIMSKANAEIIDLIKALTKDVNEMKLAIKELQEDNASSAINAEKMYKTLNVKFDLFKNLESQAQENVQQTAATTTRKPTRPAFFKKIFLEEREKYFDVLYTSDEVDAVFKEKEVTDKKKETDRATKAATIIYTRHIKGNSPEGRQSAFSNEYDSYIRGL